VAEPIDLALRFAADHPDAAARILQTLESADAAAFLEACPVEVAVTLIERMTPAAAGQALWRMRRAAACARLEAAAPRPAAYALRTLNSAEAERLLAKCDAAATRRIRRHLALPDDVVGSWIDRSFAAFGAQATASDVLEAIRGKTPADSGVIYLVGEGLIYRGLLTVPDLLKLGAGATVMRHRRAVPPLNERTPLQSAQQRTEWDELGTLPVVDRRDRLVGALSRAGLRRGLESTAAHNRQGLSGDAIMAISTAYYEGLGGMLRTVIEPNSGEPGKGTGNGQ
jgi:Mg/Co/Ni transporter MgtE